MEIITCIKRVPDIPDFVKIDASGKDIQRNELIFKINEWDEYAVETALQIKEKLGGSFTAVTVGTEECEDILRRALALGADKAIRVNEDVINADSFVIAKIMSTLISRLPYLGFRLFNRLQTITKITLQSRKQVSRVILA